jgi:hypothetical protein
MLKMLLLMIALSGQPEAISGLLCYEEATSAQIAQFYVDGGQSLEDEVSDDAVTQGLCVRIDLRDPLIGYVVYEGARVGDKQVIGLAPNPEGPAQLFGLIWAKHLPQKNEA